MGVLFQTVMHVVVSLLAIFISSVPARHQIVPVFLGEQDIILNCSTTEQVRWAVAPDDDKEEIQDIEYLEGNEEKFEFMENLLKIRMIETENLETYQCLSKNGTVLDTFKVERAFRLQKMPPSFTVTEGSMTEEIRCSFKQSWREVVFVWLTKAATGKEDNVRPVCVKMSGNLCPATREYNQELDNLAMRVTIIEGHEGEEQFSILRINETVPEDRRIFICKAFDKAAVDKNTVDCKAMNACDEVETLLRVKDKLAPLWPALGVLAEVIILVLFLVVVEKRKKE